MDVLAEQLETSDFTIEELMTMGNPHNPRWMSETDMQSLRASLREFDLVEPLVVNRQSNQIVGGHQRVQAAASEGFTHLTAIIVDLSPAKEMALNLALNRIKGEWDYKKLAVVFADLEGEDWEATGWQPAEVDSILASLGRDSDLMSTFAGDVKASNLVNADAAELEQVIQQQVRVRFGMFATIVTLTDYERWIEALEAESQNGNSPMALGEIVANRLGLTPQSQETPIPFADDVEYEVIHVDADVEDEEAVNV